MPQHNYDPKAISATFKVFERGDYELLVGEPKAFQKTNREGNEQFGIRWKLKIENVVEDGSSDAVGEKTIYSCYLHGGAEPFGKIFAMACLGFENTPEGESEFDSSEFADMDWSFDTESGMCGDGWRRCVGCRVISLLSVMVNKENGNKMQQFESFRPAA